MDSVAKAEMERLLHKIGELDPVSTGLNWAEALGAAQGYAQRVLWLIEDDRIAEVAARLDLPADHEGVAQLVELMDAQTLEQLRRERNHWHGTHLCEFPTCDDCHGCTEDGGRRKAGVTRCIDCAVQARNLALLESEKYQ